MLWLLRGVFTLDNCSCVCAVCRLKAALRRLDVRDADDFDEVEYKAASEAVRQQTQAIVQVCLLCAACTSHSTSRAAAYGSVHPHRLGYCWAANNSCWAG
jgi:hypothetical protein